MCNTKFSYDRLYYSNSATHKTHTMVTNNESGHSATDKSKTKNSRTIESTHQIHNLWMNKI